MSLTYRRFCMENPEMGKKDILDLCAVVPGTSLTKQSFKDSADINKILQRAQISGSVDHLTEHQASYGEFANYDLLSHFEMLEKADAIFSDLPSEVRNEFKNQPAAFFDFVNDPANVDRLAELLPAIAEPGSYFPDVSPSTPPGALLEPRRRRESDKEDQEPESEVTP